MYIDAEPFGPEFPDGWRSIKPDIHEGWNTKTGYCIYFNGDKSPNLMVPRGQKAPFFRVLDWNIRDEMLANAGNDTETPYYWKMVVGLPPSVDIPDKIITHKLLESNRALESPVWFDLKRTVVAGLDLGFRAGGDPCAIDFCQVGTDEKGMKIAAWSRDARKLVPKVTNQEAFEKQISVQVIDQCRENNCHHIALDVTGDGGILLQAIEKEARNQNYQLSVLPVSFSGTADDAVKTPGDKRLPTEIYGNKVSQLWVQFRKCVEKGILRGLAVNHQAVRELCGRKFATDEKRRFLVEPKKEFKKRLRHSPDSADARTLCCWMALKQGLDAGLTLTDQEKAARNREQFEEQVAPQEYSGHASSYGYSGH